MMWPLLSYDMVTISTINMLKQKMFLNQCLNSLKRAQYNLTVRSSRAENRVYNARNSGRRIKR